jgi:hypothetical protein
MSLGIVLGLLVFICGCTPEVTHNEMVGAWVMPRSDLPLAKVDSHVEDLPRLVLTRNGTFFAHNFPGKILYPGGSETGLFSGTGHWWLSRLGGFQTVRLAFQEMENSATAAEIELNIDSGNDHLYLFAWQDEEGSRRLKFEQAK